MLKDKYFRSHNYLRISITDKCNLRCKYCMPPEGVELLPHYEILRNEEYLRLIKIFVELGVDKIRFTGGEPLVRKGFQDIIAKARELYPNIKMGLTTNGVLLHKFIDDLAAFNVSGLNISLDTLSQERYKSITGVDCFDDVVANIKKAISMDTFKVKVNAVLFDETIKELDDFLEFQKDKNFTLRFIERMPFSDEDASENIVTHDNLVNALKERGELVRDEKSDTNVAVMYRLKYKDKYSLNIGIIPPMSHKFCSTCNRLRLTSDGALKTCLHSAVEYDLKKIIRAGEDDDYVKDVILHALNLKQKGHTLDCYSDDGGCSAVVNTRTMSKIGG